MMMTNIVLCVFVFISRLAFAAESLEPFAPVSLGSRLELPRTLTWLYGEKPPIKSWEFNTWVFVFIPTSIENIEPILRRLDLIQKHTAGVKTLLVAVSDAPKTENEILYWRDQFLQTTKSLTSEQRWQSSTFGHGVAFDESQFFLRRWLQPSGTASRLPIAFVVSRRGQVQIIAHLNTLNDTKYFEGNFVESAEFQHYRMVFMQEGKEWIAFERARVQLEDVAQSGDWGLAVQLASKIDEAGPNFKNWRNWSFARAMRLKALFHLGYHAEHIGTARIYEQEDAELFSRKSQAIRFASKLLWWPNHTLYVSSDNRSNQSVGNLLWRQNTHWILQSRAELFKSFLENSSADEIGRNQLVRRWATNYEKPFLNLRYDSPLDFSWLSYTQPLEQAGEILEDSKMIDRYAEIRLANQIRLKCFRQLLPARPLGIADDAHPEARSTLIRYEMQ